MVKAQDSKSCSFEIMGSNPIPVVVFFFPSFFFSPSFLPRMGGVIQLPANNLTE